MQYLVFYWKTIRSVYFNNTYPDTLLWFITNCHQDIDI